MYMYGPLLPGGAQQLATVSGSVGSASGTGTATGASGSIGTASGTGTATGVSGSIGTASGTGTATGAGDSGISGQGTGSASGTGTATGASGSAGTAAGTGTAAAVSASGLTVGTATGVGTASGVSLRADNDDVTFGGSNRGRKPKRQTTAEVVRQQRDPRDISDDEFWRVITEKRKARAESERVAKATELSTISAEDQQVLDMMLEEQRMLEEQALEILLRLVA